MHIQTIKETHNPEIALIILCCRQFIHESNDNTLQEFVQQTKVSWPAVYHLSKIHRIRPVIYQELVRIRDIIGSENLQELRDNSFYFNAFALNNKRELNRIFSLLKQNNISAHAFKGIDFAETIYGNIGLREFSDNDIIINESSIPDVIRMMIDEGYRSKDIAFYSRFPKQYVRDYKDLLFEKTTGNVRDFAFEFHFKPTRYFQGYPFSFSEVIGKNYLAEDYQYNETDYFKLMILNNGLMDFYPNLRSVLDLAVIIKKRNSYTVPDIDHVLKSYLRLGNKLSAELLNYPTAPENFSLNINEIKFCNRLQENILKMKQGKRVPVSQYFFRSIKNSRSVKRKMVLITNLMRLIIRPNEDDLSALNLSNYNLYYFTKPFRLIFKVFHQHNQDAQ